MQKKKKSSGPCPYSLSPLKIYLQLWKRLSKYTYRASLLVTPYAFAEGQFLGAGVSQCVQEAGRMWQGANVPKKQSFPWSEVE